MARTPFRRWVCSHAWALDSSPPEIVTHALGVRGFAQAAQNSGPQNNGRVTGPRHYPSLSSTLRNTRGRELLRIVDIAVPNLKHIKEFTVLLNALALDGQWRRVIRLLREMREVGIIPNVIIYNYLLAAAAKDKKVEKALEVLEEMREKRVIPDLISYNHCIGACNADHWPQALEILEEIPRIGLERDGTSFENAVMALEEASEWQRALDVFAEVQKRELQGTSVGYNYALSACRRAGPLSGVWRHAFELMKEMEQQNFEPDFRLKQDLEAQSRGLEKAPPPEPSQRRSASPDNVWQRKQQLRELREQDKLRQEEKRLERERLDREQREKERKEQREQQGSSTSSSSSSSTPAAASTASPQAQPARRHEERRPEPSKAPAARQEERRSDPVKESAPARRQEERRQEDRRPEPSRAPAARQEERRPDPVKESASAPRQEERRHEERRPEPSRAPPARQEERRPDPAKESAPASRQEERRPDLAKERGDARRDDKVSSEDKRPRTAEVEADLHQKDVPIAMPKRDESKPFDKPDQRWEEKRPDSRQPDKEKVDRRSESRPQEERRNSGRPQDDRRREGRPQDDRRSDGRPQERKDYKPKPKLRSPGSYVLPVFAQHDRSNHAERQALIKVIARVQDACGAQTDDEFEKECAEVTGTVRLYASHTPCISCMACFCQFQRLFPKVKLCVDFDDWRDTRRMVEMARREEEHKRRGSKPPNYDCDGLSEMSDEEEPESDDEEDGEASREDSETARAQAA